MEISVIGSVLVALAVFELCIWIFNAIIEKDERKEK